MLSDTHTACVAIALALCLKKKTKIRLWTKEWYKEIPHTRIKIYERIKAE
jgi:hypothetical protein